MRWHYLHKDLANNDIIIILEDGTENDSHTILVRRYIPDNAGENKQKKETKVKHIFGTLKMAKTFQKKFRLGRNH